MRSRSVLLRELLHHREGVRLCGGDCGGHPATLQCFEPKGPDHRRLGDHARGAQALQHKHARAAQSQLDGRKKSDRPGSRNHNINLFIHISSSNLYSVHNLRY